MNILFIFGSLGQGGAQKILTYVANTCSRYGYKVIIATYSQDVPTVLINPDISLIRLNNQGKFLELSSINKAKDTIRCIRQIRKIIFENKIDVLCAFMPHATKLAVGAALGTKCKVLSSERDNPYRLSKIKWNVNNFFYSCCDLIVFQTEKAKECFKINVKTKAIVIPNPCIPRKSKIEPFDGEREKTIISAGRLSPVKNFDVLIEAFAKVNEKHPDYKLKIYGEGPERKKLENLIVEFGLESCCTLEGMVVDPMAIGYNSSLFVLASKNEGIPNVLIEAMSIGIPCVASDCMPGGPRLLLDDGNRGILVEVDNVQELANAINTLIENPEQTKKYGEKSLEIIEEFNPDKIGSMWLDAFKNL